MAKGYWLVKSEPSVYPWERFVKEKQTVWDGVRSFEREVLTEALLHRDAAVGGSERVPGLVKEKVQAYVKGMPQRLRQHLIDDRAVIQPGLGRIVDEFGQRLPGNPLGICRPIAPTEALRNRRAIVIFQKLFL